MLTLVESSSLLVVSLNKVKTHLRIDHDAEDSNLKLMIKAATSLVEQEIGRSLLTKVWKQCSATEITKEGFARVLLPYPPLIEVLSVGEICCTTTVRPIRRYVVEWERTIPSVLVGISAAKLQVIYQAGFGDKPSMVPAAIRQAILMLVAEMYEKKTTDSCILQNSMIKSLLAPYKATALV